MLGGAACALSLRLVLRAATLGYVEAESFEELEFFRAILSSGARAILIGRRALIALGLPVLTQDYDFWLHIDDIAMLNEAVASLDLVANRSPAEARQRGRYKLEDGVTVDVLVGRGLRTTTGERVLFDDVWERRVEIDVAPGVSIFLPALDDLIATKRFGARPKDAEDIRLLQRLKARLAP